LTALKAILAIRNFKTFHIEQAKAFKRDLADQRDHQSGEPPTEPSAVIISS
jgi:hypothetical protein